VIAVSQSAYTETVDVYSSIDTGSGTTEDTMPRAGIKRG